MRIWLFGRNRYWEVLLVWRFISEDGEFCWTGVGIGPYFFGSVRWNWFV